MSSGGTGGGGVIIIHKASVQGTSIAVSDLQSMVDALPDGALKTMLQDYLANLPSE